MCLLPNAFLFFYSGFILTITRFFFTTRVPTFIFFWDRPLPLFPMLFYVLSNFKVSATTRRVLLLCQLKVATNLSNSKFSFSFQLKRVLLEVEQFIMASHIHMFLPIVFPSCYVQLVVQPFLFLFILFTSFLVELTLTDD